MNEILMTIRSYGWHANINHFGNNKFYPTTLLISVGRFNIIHTSEPHSDADIFDTLSHITNGGTIKRKIKIINNK